MRRFKQKFEEIKFIFPIIIGLVLLWLICKFMLTRNIIEMDKTALFILIDIWFTFRITKHWWKMARDEEYKKERLRWLKLPLDKRENGLWWGAQMDLIGAIILSLIVIILIFYQKLIIN